MDMLSKEKRSWNMSRIRSKDTEPEKVVRSLLHRMGYRFRLHVRSLPGSPDVVMPKFKTVLFVHGCFWHRHSGCRYAYTPKSRTDFWNQKFEQNIRSDEKAGLSLQSLGWRVVVIWECETRDLPALEMKILSLFPRNPVRSVFDAS
jgi:DNA mismatch endonuclease, patch repair protein